MGGLIIVRWGDFLDKAPLPPLEAWAWYHWRPKGNIYVALMGSSLILFEFELSIEAKRDM